MDNRVALIGIIVQDFSCTNQVNKLLNEYRDFIVGRMGIPYKQKHNPVDIGIISVALDAPQDKISALTGKLGMIDGVSVKTIYSKF